MRVAIDGPAGSGKSTVAKAIAKRCGITMLDTGAMYRAVALACVERGVDVNDEEGVLAIAKSIRISFGQGADGQTVSVDGKDVTAAIRTPEIDKAVSPVSAMAPVRAAMVEQQRAISEGLDVVAEGRDIGTVVFPDAEVKVFLTADPRARAMRRAVQREGGDAAKGTDTAVDETAVEEILADIMRRDHADSTRAASPLVPAEDAVHIDSSLMSVDEVVDAILALNDDLKALDRG